MHFTAASSWTYCGITCSPRPSKKSALFLNHYDTCVANRVINNKQCTITWHVDDLKISHVDSSVVNGVIKAIKFYFGKTTVTKSAKYKYVGIEFTSIGDGKVNLFQKERSLECI